MQIQQFSGNSEFSFTMPVEMMAFCNCFEMQTITKLTGNGLMEIDSVQQIGRISSIAMQNTQEQALRGTRFIPV